MKKKSFELYVSTATPKPLLDRFGLTRRFFERRKNKNFSLIRFLKYCFRHWERK